MDASVEPVTLEGRVVRLEPLRPEHARGLCEVGDPELFVYINTRVAGPSLRDYEEFIPRVLAIPHMASFAIVLRETGRPIGSTAYLDIRPKDRGLEIGATWIARPWQGTLVNPEMKFLLFRHAFETLGMLRVQLKTDARNLHSQRAIEKLGARREGVLRKHIILLDGYVRDTVMYSVTDDEWPRVKAGLEARLGYTPGVSS
jgi:RimJ/RimL family protein N-acetyltransferase